MAKTKKPAGPKSRLLDAAREHQDELQAAGLSPQILESYEQALRGVARQGRLPSAAVEVLARDVQREVGEVQAAIRKEFSGNPSFQSVFAADKPMPAAPREVLALGRRVAREAPDFAQNLIKYAINAATVNHLRSLCDQLEKELGGEDPQAEARALEAQIEEAARRAFAGKPELAAFEAK